MGLGLDKQQKNYSDLSSGIIKIGTDSDDPTLNIVDNGDGTINVAFPVKYRIVDRVNDANGAPANNQFSQSRSSIFNSPATANIDYTALPDGNVIIYVDDTQTVKLIQLVSGEAVLPVFSEAEPDINSGVQLGSITLTGGAVSAGTNEASITTNNNIQNKTRNINRTLGTINSLDNPVIITPIAGTVGVAKNAGVAFLSGDGNYAQSKGFNPNQNQVVAASPELILTVNRVGDGNIVSVSTSINVTEYESTPGVFSLIGSSKAANRFVLPFSPFSAELLGQTPYSGGSRLIDASEANESVDNPAISRFAVLAAQISVENGATDLSLIAQAIFIPLKQFR